MVLNMVPSSGEQVLGDVDLVSTDDLRRMAKVSGPCVTVYLATAPAAALDGKVDTLFIDAAQAATSEDEILEQAVVETVQRSGTVVAVDEAAGPEHTAAAVLRY